MAKRSYTVIAEHFGSDESDIKEAEYQPGRFTSKVYSISGDVYMAAGKKAPIDKDGVMKPWVKKQSSFDPSAMLWVYENTGAC